MTNLLTPTSILLEFLRLRQEVGEWANKNFDVHLPHLGIAEEVGELTHAVLKREQKIRDEADGKTIAAITDALADACVYLLHFEYLHKLTPGFSRELVPITKELEILGALHRTAGAIILDVEMFRTKSVLLQSNSAHIRTLLWNFAELHQLNLLQITQSTWSEVSKRDWRTFPSNGLTA